MSASRVPGPVTSGFDLVCLPARSPGSLGLKDSADPTGNVCRGDTPGALGSNDGADPNPDMTLPFWQSPGFAYSCWLPKPHPNPPKLSDDDFKKAAAKYGVEAAAIHAVAKVESEGRSGFDDRGRPKILFEAHIFHKFTKGKYDRDYPELSQKTWENGKVYYSLDQWTRMYQAMDLDRDAAWKSASWGMFQVMGFNHSGFPSVPEFVAAMFESEAQHLKSFLAFCKDNGLVQPLKAKDWSTFARSYNGPGYKKNKYDEKMEEAYRQYKADETKKAKAQGTGQ